MGRFRKKPVEIDAIQWTGDNLEEVEQFVGEVSFDGDTQCAFILNTADLQSDTTAFVWDKLHDTWVGVMLGQWIIKGTKGETYPCDPDVFEESYEGVSD